MFKEEIEVVKLILSVALLIAYQFVFASDVIPHDRINVDHIMEQFWLRVASGEVSVSGETLKKTDLEVLKVIF